MIFTSHICFCISLFLSGVVLGILTGMRGLCNGLGPALFGVLFYFSDVHLESFESTSVSAVAATAMKPHPPNSSLTITVQTHV